jgi:hypothetical protein
LRPRWKGELDCEQLLEPSQVIARRDLKPHAVTVGMPGRAVEDRCRLAMVFYYIDGSGRLFRQKHAGDDEENDKAAHDDAQDVLPGEAIVDAWVKTKRAMHSCNVALN